MFSFTNPSPTPQTFPLVPQDMWVCCQCQQGNLIATSPACPTCGHARDSYCPGPGQSYGYSFSLASISPSYIDSTTAFQDVSWMASLLSSGRGGYHDSHFPQVTTNLIEKPSFSPCGQELTDYGAGSPAAGSWICGNCGSANSDLTPDFCPVCEAQR